jgi:hypothetical protein
MVEGIDTTLDGDPESVRVLARWIEAECAGRVDACADVLKRARDEAERGWRGEDAAIWFRVGLDGDGRNAARLARDAERVARVLETYADNLAHAQDLVQQARDEALEAGLVVRDAVIYYPDEGVTAPAAAPPADAQQWARTVNEHRIAAYQHTSALVFQANDLLSDTGLESLVDELWGNRYFMTVT